MVPLNNEVTKYYSSKQEASVAKSLGWDRVVASGARDFHPGDVCGNDWLGECKTHVSRVDKIEFRKSTWKKLMDESVNMFKYPVLFVDNGTQLLGSTWCMFSDVLDLTNVVTVEFPFVFKSNVGFNESGMQNYVVNILNNPEFNPNNLDDVVFKLNFHGDSVCVSRFLTYKSLVAGEI